MLKWLEKLINEHGSAAILKERISLLTDRIADLERKLKAAEAERDSLRLEVPALKSQIGSLQAHADEVRRLQKDANGQNLQRLDDERERILLAVCANPDRFTDDVAEMVGLSPQRAQWHLDNLLAAKLIHDAIIVSTAWGKGGLRWTTSARGLDYLARNGLLQA